MSDNLSILESVGPLEAVHAYLKPFIGVINWGLVDSRPDQIVDRLASFIKMRRALPTPVAGVYVQNMDHARAVAHLVDIAQRWNYVFNLGGTSDGFIESVNLYLVICCKLKSAQSGKEWAGSMLKDQLQVLTNHTLAAESMTKKSSSSTLKL